MRYRKPAAFAAVSIIAAALFAGCMPGKVDARRERLLRVDEDARLSTAGRELPEGELTLAAAVDYALLNNLSIRAAELDHAVKSELKHGAVLRMLPTLQASAEYTYRDEPNASWSESLYNHDMSLEPSVSSEQGYRPIRLPLVWSLLDFGLAAIRASQAEEQARISAEALRRLRQQIAMETTIAYYRAWSAQEVVREAGSLEQAARIQLSVNRGEAEKRSLSRSEEAQRAMPLLMGMRSLRDFGKEWQNARIALARAMGAPDAEAIRLPAYTEYALPTVGVDAELLVSAALANRPEMYQGDGNLRISESEAKAALLQLYPNVRFTAALNQQSDKYLIYHNWMENGVRITWDLLSIPSRLKERSAAQKRVELERMRARVTAASIVVQVNLALWEFRDAADRLNIAAEIAETRKALVSGAEAALAHGKASGADVIVERIRYVSDYAAKCRVRSECMAAHARLAAAMGADPAPTAATQPATVQAETAAVHDRLLGELVPVAGAAP